jgi:hypothetical protein
MLTFLINQCSRCSPASLPSRSAVRALEAGDLRQPPAPARGQPPQQVAEALAIGASHPTWMVAGWLQQYGPAATLALLKHNNA